ncbi:hypothetical protein MH117_23660 [Paenibacillus sp. ACRRX]|uniref:hypothetical protein n=1 Tax=unclassified Paenibacillus TaxID=185978 RepID=UPI001EF61CA2|nr:MULTISPECIES: hypothetical protein [unclassified Paenibacillus]MCG7410395.1 hypothetical protein [Paenibacillus sp. ACRRX]MDK8183817.1 hypothetical protein [Paenibacillus sp. UMB4589-SE434]
MIPIPLDERTISQFCGRSVGVVTKDGREYIGRLSHCENGKLILNADSSPAHLSGETKETAPSKKKGKKSKAKTSPDTSPTAVAANYIADPYAAARYSYPYRPFNYGPRVDLDLALVSLLFLLVL